MTKERLVEELRAGVSLVGAVYSLDNRRVEFLNP
jgi:hypothetical protein